MSHVLRRHKTRFNSISNRFLLLTLLANLFNYTAAYNYLIVSPTLAHSHYAVNTALAKGLADAGHDVTYVTPFTLDGSPNLTVITISGGTEPPNRNITEPVYLEYIAMQKFGLRMSERFLQDANVQLLLGSNQKFDAVICEVFWNEVLFGFAEHFQAPLIGLSASSANVLTNKMTGMPSPPSYVPHTLLPFSHEMSLKERLINLALLTYETVLLENCFMPKKRVLYKKYFPENKQTLDEVINNTALVLLNQHPAINFPRPQQPNVIEVAGLQIPRKTNELPPSIKTFINESPQGVIYFSMGSSMKSKDLPTIKLQAILNVLSTLKQRVIWKFDNPNLSEQFPNVLINAHFPQNDILAHPKVIAFITHGSLMSTTESAYHGKPVVGIPVYADQYLHIACAVNSGYGLSVPYSELTEERLREAIMRVISDSTFTHNAKAISAVLRDQLETPLERAIYWIEYVTRHKGAPHLHSTAQDLTLIEYHNLDAILILYGGVLLTLFLMCLLIRYLWRLLQEYFVRLHEARMVPDAAAQD